MRSGFISTTVHIVFLLVCIAAAVDTHLFVYPSLSRSLLMECGLLLLALVAFCHRALYGVARPVGGLCIFAALWMGYILLHGRLSEVMELYRSMYLCVTLLSVISLSYCLRAGLLTSEGIFGGLLVIGLIHVFCVFAQWLRFMEPENSLYPVTGACDNPNVTAMYLVGCLPLMVQRLPYSNRNVLYGTFVIFSLLCLAILRCRTAYIGLAVEVVVMLLAYGKARRLVFSHRWVVVGIGVLVCAFFAVKLYNMKRDSADGRLLIWKVSASMIAEHPMGQGYGLFPKHYNLRQAEYFHEEHGSDTERRNASFVYMAYNDFLEHGVEGGVIGMLFLIGFYVMTIKDPPRPSKGGRWLTAVLSAYAVMSLVNFVVAGIQTWLLVICCAAMVAAGNGSRTDEPEETVGDYSLLLHKLTSVALIVLVLILSVITIRMTYAQYQLGRIEKRMSAGEDVSDSAFADLENDIYSSEAYWNYRAVNLINQKNYNDALVSVERALEYTSAPTSLMLQSHCLLNLGDTARAVSCIRNIRDMQPCKPPCNR